MKSDATVSVVSFLFHCGKEVRNILSARIHCFLQQVLRELQFLFLSPSLHPHPVSYMASDKDLLVSGLTIADQEATSDMTLVSSPLTPSSGNLGPRVSLIIPGAQ